MKQTKRTWCTRAVLLVGIAVVSMAYPVAAETVTAQAAKKAGRARPGDAILGEWWTEGRQGRIRFRRHKSGTYMGITTWRNPKNDSEDDPAIDVNNPDPKKRGRSTVGIVIIWNLTYDEDGEYCDGYVYNPRDGDVYRMKVELVDPNTLSVRGYIGIPLLGQTQTWKRSQPASKRAATASKKK